VAAAGPDRRGRLAGGAGPPRLAGLSTTVVLSAVALLLADAIRGRDEARRRLVEQEHVSEAERARRLLLEERARIARELHDVVAHHMSVIAIQAEAAPHRVPDPPEALTASFSSIRANAVEALTELRRVLGVLRAERGGDLTAGPTAEGGYAVAAVLPLPQVEGV